MFLVLWEFDVKQGCEERFESVYGPRAIGSGCSFVTMLTSELSSCAIRLDRELTSLWTSGLPRTRTNRSGKRTWKRIQRSTNNARSLPLRNARSAPSSRSPKIPKASKGLDYTSPHFDWTQQRARLLHAFAHSGTKPSGFRSGCRNSLGVPAARNTASAAR